MPGVREDLFLPDGVPMRVAEQLAAALDQLYPVPDCDDQRYRATKHVIWAAAAVMMGRGVSALDAVETIVSVLAELLVGGLGTHGAAVHLRLVADSIDIEKAN